MELWLLEKLLDLLDPRLFRRRAVQGGIGLSALLVLWYRSVQHADEATERRDQVRATRAERLRALRDRREAAMAASARSTD